MARLSASHLHIFFSFPFMASGHTINVVHAVKLFVERGCRSTVIATHYNEGFVLKEIEKVVRNKMMGIFANLELPLYVFLKGTARGTVFLEDHGKFFDPSYIVVVTLSVSSRWRNTLRVRENSDSEGEYVGVPRICLGPFLKAEVLRNEVPFDYS